MDFRRQLVKTAAQAANPYLYEGIISEECHGCIVNQFARRIPIEEQEPCGLLCAHDLCDMGAPLDPACDPCVAYICNYVDSYCCEYEWDWLCVWEADDMCEIDCP